MDSQNLLEKSEKETDRAAKAFSRPPLIRSEIDGKDIRLVGQGEQLDVTLDGKVLTSIAQWQYTVLNGLVGHGGDTIEGVQELVQDRYGISVVAEDLAKFFRKLDAFELIDADERLRRPLVVKLLSDEAGEDPVKAAKTKSVGTAKAERKPGFAVLRPTFILRMLRPFFWIAKLAMFFLPPLLVVAAFDTYTHWDAILTSYTAYSRNEDLFLTLFLGLFSVNFFATAVHACAAYEMGVTVEAIVLRRVFGILPRLAVRLDDTEKLSRRQAMWMHGATLAARLYVGVVAVLLYSSSQHFGVAVNEIALTIAVIAFLSFLLTACPFYRGSGYYLMAEFLDEPNLRPKAFKALFNLWNRTRYQNSDPQILIAFALVSIAYSLIVVGLAFLLFGKRFAASLGPDGLILIAVLVCAFLWKTGKQLQKTNEFYWKNYRFERWRDKTLPSQAQRDIADRSRVTFWRAVKMMALAGLVIVMLQNYTYRPSGPVTMLPQALSELSTDQEGIVSEVFFAGGETLKKGTVVAKLSTADLEAQLRIREAELSEAKIKYDFAKLRCDRNQSLFDAKSISEVQLQEALSECAEAEAERQIVLAEIDRLNYRIERASFKMPYDGQLGSLYLRERLGTFLDEGAPIASVRDTSAFRVRMKLREVDLALVEEGAPIEVRVYAYPDEVFWGVVESIDPDVASTDRGQLIEMVGSIDNSSGLLRSGLTGVAKTAGTEMPIWRIVTQGIYRFVIIDLWARLP